MSKYHVNQNTGRPNICKASKKACPVGGEHFDSKEEALAGIEAQASQENPTIQPALKKRYPSFRGKSSLSPAELKAFGKIKTATTTVDSITFNNGDRNLTFTVSGDCCSTSVLVEPEAFAKAAEGKTITSFSYGDSSYDDEESSYYDEVVRVSDHNVTFSDGSTYTLQDKNYSNGYYGTDTDWRSE